MRKRAIISATYDENIPDRNKIIAADGVMGVIVLLAYWAGGTNLFPEGVMPEFFVDRRSEDFIKINVEGLTDLIGELSKAKGREIGQLSIGSLPVYLASLRRGERANGNGKMIPVQTTYSRISQILEIESRDFDRDSRAGLVELIPDGIV